MTTRDRYEVRMLPAGDWHPISFKDMGEALGLYNRYVLAVINQIWDGKIVTAGNCDYREIQTAEVKENHV